MSVRSGDGRAKRAAVLTAGPWKQWPKTMTRAARCIRFVELYCVLPKGVGHGKPMRLAFWQKQLLRKALADGISRIITSFPRGNGKSTLGAAVAVWALFDDDADGTPQVPIIATTVGQAKRSIYGVAVHMIAKSPELESRSISYTGTAEPKVVVPYNGGEMFPIANDVDGLQGLDPSFALFDEIGFQHKGAWDALILACGKRPHETIWGMGTPGLDQGNALYALRTLVKQGVVIPGLVYLEWSADEGCSVHDRAQWRKANPALRAGFLRLSALVTEEKSILHGADSAFRIFRLGQWVSGFQNWLGTDGHAIWAKCLSPYEMVHGEPTWVGIDVAIKQDSTAVVIIQKRPDGRWHSRLKLWVPTDEEPVDVREVMSHIRALSREFKLGAVSFDPRFFDVPAKLLYEEGLPMVEVPQSPERMTSIIGELYKAIHTVQITHDDDPAFAMQVLNAVARLNARGFTLAKGKSKGRIDAAIALSLALDRAQHVAKARSRLVVR